MMYFLNVLMMYGKLWEIETGILDLYMLAFKLAQEQLNERDEKLKQNNVCVKHR